MHPIDYELKMMLEGNFEEARRVSDELQELGPEEIKDNEGEKNPEMWIRHSFNRGWFMLQKGDYQEGSKLLENGRFVNAYGSGFLKTNAPIWNPSEHTIEGKSIILALEGGYGDEIIHVRFATQLKKRGFQNVYVAASPNLFPLFERIEGVDKVINREQAHTVSHDYWIPGFSAGWVLGNTYDTVYNGPYLTVNPTSSQVWQEFVSTDKIKVGIRWAGNPEFEHQQFRTFPHQFLTELNRYKELQIYSFQRDDNTIELPEDIVDLQYLLPSWEDTLAALSKMDLIITSCTSIAHAAAALGKPTWVIVPLLPYHTWTKGAPESNKSPFYDSVTIYRQKKKGEWGETFDLLYKDLEDHFSLEPRYYEKVNENKKKLNLGCGNHKLPGFINIDISPKCKPDVVQDLMSFPWAFEDNSVEHIVAKDVLEHVGSTPKDFIDVLKEMYRVSKNGAVWEVQFPHHRCDIAYDDPTHVRILTQKTFKMFDRKNCEKNLESNFSDSPLSLEYDIDIEVCDVKHIWVSYWEEKLISGEINSAKLYENLNTLNNVAESVILLIQVHKPVRFPK